MVHGSMADHTTFEAFINALRDGSTSFAMDRRGFGASGDTMEAGYAIDREFEDVAAVVDAVAALEMTEDEIDAFRSNPLWPTRLAAAPTIPRECRVEDTWDYQPGLFDAITAPTLLLTGSDSVPAVTKATHDAAAAIPHAQIHVLAGHGHFAHKTDPTMVATLLHTFINPQTP